MAKKHSKYTKSDKRGPQKDRKAKKMTMRMQNIAIRRKYEKKLKEKKEEMTSAMEEEK